MLRELKRNGVLLAADTTFPNVVMLVAGGPVRGSWWAHPLAHEIYSVSHPLGEHQDVIVTKLVSGKATYVHRRLWPAIAAVGVGRARWQLDGLSPAAKRLLSLVRRNTDVRTDEVPRSADRKDSPGEAARELERRLLVSSHEVHTERGAHAKQLETWERWSARVGIDVREMTVADGKRQLEEVVAALNEPSGASGRLPWQAARRR